MIRKPRGFFAPRLACLGLMASLTVSSLFGCSQEEPAPVQTDGGHAKEVTKNMADFMKTSPYKNVGKEKVQLK